MSETADFGKYANRDFKKAEVLPAGTYEVEILKWEKCVAKTGMEQIRIYATVVSPDDYAGKSLIDHIAMSSNAEWRIVWFISDALGWEPEDRKAVGKIAINSERMARCFDLAKGRTMIWDIIVDGKFGNNKVTGYTTGPDEKVDVSELDGEVPDFLKHKE